MTSRNDPGDLLDLKFVGPATAAVLEDDGIDAADVAERRVSHARLVEAGVNPGVAAKIRREHSLAWSMSGGEDLDRRAEQVRGLQDDERAWVAASSGSWSEESPTAEVPSTDGRGSATDGESAWQADSWPQFDGQQSDDTAEIAWREASSPTPVTALATIDERDAAALGEAGITSVRSLATANPDRVAESLDIDEERVRAWRDAARSHEE
ncbi:MAG: helix-hairpin-helix domain-containing protein [archaeon]